MKFNKATQLLMRSKQQGVSVLSLLILNLVKRQPLYLREIREFADLDAGTNNKAVNALVVRGYLEKEHVPITNESGRGAPLSALIHITDKGMALLDGS